MNVALIALGIVCGLLGVALGVVGITLWHFINNRPFRYIYDDAKARAVKRLEAELSELRQKNRELEMQKQKPESPKPDAAKECGVVPPKFDDTAPCIEVNGRGDARNKNRRRGMEKVIVTTRDGYSTRFYNLADFYYCAEARKCDFSPPEKMEEPQRLHHIAREIAKYYRAAGIQPLNIKLFRRGKWHIFRAGVEI